VDGFWPAEFAELADGPTGSGNVGECWVFIFLARQCDGQDDWTKHGAA
jgi:hypothetical protein